jgi:hypothetical protein
VLLQAIAEALEEDLDDLLQETGLTLLPGGAATSAQSCRSSCGGYNASA